MNKSKTGIQFIRFLLVGTSTVLVDLIVYRCLSLLLDISVSKGISFMVGTLYAYNFNRRWTFNMSTFRLIQLLKFIIVYSIGMSINISVNKLFLELIFSNYPEKLMLSFIVATGFSAIANFTGMKFFVFISKDK